MILKVVVLLTKGRKARKAKGLSRAEMVTARVTRKMEMERAAAVQKDSWKNPNH
jgi:hypothetical protein